MTGREGLAEAGAGSEGLEARVARAVVQARTWLLGRQHPSGYWQAPLEANATLEARYVFLGRLLGRDRGDIDRRLADRLLALQQDDGGWALATGIPSDLSASVEAYLALRLTGLAADEPALARARDFVLGAGGVARTGVLTRCWLACLGQFPWDGVPAIPVELVLLPPWSPVGLHAMASWARATIVPLSLVLAYRPARRLPDGVDVQALWARPPARADYAARRSGELVTLSNAFLALDRTLAALGRSPWKPLRRRAVARAIEWVLRHQDKSGQWAGMHAATLQAALALHAVGFAHDHPVMVGALQGVDDLLVECEGTLACQPSGSATADTALAARALVDAGVDPADPALARAGAWLVRQQILRAGDWSVSRPDLDPGGWAVQPANDWYPDVAHSAAVLLALLPLPLAAAVGGRRALIRGLDWTLGMQAPAGGWAAYDAGGGATLLGATPFADAGTMTDPPCADVTGVVLELIGACGLDLDHSRARRAAAFLRRAQREDGSWSGRWGVSFLHGTTAALRGLCSAGDDLRAPHVRRAVDWLLERQNADGGFGETVGSDADASLAGRGDSTPTQTGWALLALVAAGEVRGEAAARAAAWLVRAQTDAGTWEERAFTGTALPRRMYLRWHLHRHVYPLMALARWHAARAGAH